MELVVNAGSARSIAIEAIRAAKSGDFAKADAMLGEADKTLLKSHEVQTELIQKELNGEKVEVGLLMVHAQDHLMNAMTVMDLAREIIDILKERN
ncbi:MAG: PTS lactose/cellobiose transporter subunit IIA [Lachnospiraceae bacterium]